MRVRRPHKIRIGFLAHSSGTKAQYTKMSGGEKQQNLPSVVRLLFILRWDGGEQEPRLNAVTNQRDTLLIISIAVPGVDVDIYSDVSVQITVEQAVEV